MSNNIQNRKFPVFFIFKVFVIFIFTLLISSCKSKKDWRDDYNKKKIENKQNTKTTDSKKSHSNINKINAPKNLEDISKILDVSENKLKNKALYNFIIDWYGVPYKFGGTTENGVDCSGFTNILFKEVYKQQIPRASKEIAEKIKRKYAKDLQEGDLVFFAFGKNETINHVGVYLHNNMFVHASTSRGVIISNLTEPYYGNYLVKCGTFKTD